MQDSSCLHLMLQCCPPLDGFLNETLQGMEHSLTSWGTVVPDKGWNVPSFPGLLRLQFLIACSMQKRREKAWGISSRDPRHDRQKSSRLLSTAKGYMRPILHSVLAIKMGQAPAESYTKRMKRTQAKSHESERLQSDRRENTKQ